MDNSSVSPEQIKECGNELKNIAERLADAISQIEIDYKNLCDAVKILKSWNGSDASGKLDGKPKTSLLDNIANALFPFNEVSKHHYKLVWNIEVTDNGISSDDSLAIVASLKNSVDDLSLFGDDLNIMSEIIANFIWDIAEQLDVEFDSSDTLTGYFNKIKNNETWQDYLNISKEVSDFRNRDLIYQKYRSKTGEPDYVDYALDEAANHRVTGGSSKYDYWYMHHYDKSGMTAGAPYCAAGVSYFMISSGANQFSPYINVATGASQAQAAAKNGVGTWHDVEKESNYHPKRGDIFYKSGEHTGIVIDSDDEYMYTIEANTLSDGSTNGDGHNGGYVNTRVRRYSYITSGGFYSPDVYVNSSSSDSNVDLNSNVSTIINGQDVSYNYREMKLDIP